MHENTYNIKKNLNFEFYNGKDNSILVLDGLVIAYLSNAITDITMAIDVWLKMS